MTASNLPSLLTWSATVFVSAMLDRSPTTTPWAPTTLSRVSSARAAATGVQDDLVPLFDQKLGGHFFQAVSGVGDKDARHSEIPSPLLTQDRQQEGPFRDPRDNGRVATFARPALMRYEFRGPSR
jgi:hypothetical protein